MNTKTRLILIVALLGISAVVLAVVFVQRAKHPMSVAVPLPTTKSMSSSATPTPARKSPQALAPPTAIYKATPPIITPRAYFDLTMAITATATELKVGDTITVTVTITNTGKLNSGYPSYCNLAGYVDVDLSEWQPYEDPILDPPVSGSEVEGILIGEGQVYTFVLQAARPGTVWLEGDYGTKAIFGERVESWVGERTPLLEIHVK